MKDDLGGGAGYRASGNILDQYPLLPEVRNSFPLKYDEFLLKYDDF